MERGLSFEVIFCLLYYLSHSHAMAEILATAST